jgi:hypothetical protein
VAGLLLAAAISFVVTGGWVSIALTWLLFGAMGGALLLMSATIQGTTEGITVCHLYCSSHLRWDEVQAASSGGGNLVLYATNRRVSMPAPEFWWGSERNQLVTLVAGALGDRDVIIQKSARAAFHYDRTRPPKS